MSDNTDQYAVFGYPIGHSRSPFIHQRFAALTGQAMQYQAIEVAVNHFTTSIAEFFDAGGCGANVTLPFKQQALTVCQQISERAQRAGAVNTLIKQPNGELWGDNTDGLGLVTDLINHQVTLADAKILLVGAGGAARGVVLPLLEKQPSQLVITNRSFHKAQLLVEQFDPLWGASSQLVALPMEALVTQQFDLVINGTSAGLSGDLPQIPADCLASCQWCYDMIYADQTTHFNQWAEQLGVSQTMDGLGMLVEQAAESFRLWRGVRPPTESVLAALRAELG